MSGHLRVYAEVRGYGARGPRYQVKMNQPSGMVIVNATTEPLFAAARVLMSKGVTGKLQLWDGARPFPRMTGDIERLAGLTVSEGQDGISLRKYAERTASGDFDADPSRDTPDEIGRPGSVLQGEGDLHRSSLSPSTSERTAATTSLSARSAVPA
ncbi:MAG: hypothetical protein AB7F09_06665 [Parvibaculaceae bacterium]